MKTEELTWEDIRRIGEIGGETLAELGGFSPEALRKAYPTEELYYTEVLRRFKEYKDKTEQQS